MDKQFHEVTEEKAKAKIDKMLDTDHKPHEQSNPKNTSVNGEASNQEELTDKFIHNTG